MSLSKGAEARVFTGAGRMLKQGSCQCAAQGNWHTFFDNANVWAIVAALRAC